MPNVPSKIQTWQMTEPGKLARTTIDVPELKPGEVLVEVAGCGVCHTDLGYFYDGVPTVSKPPMTLGHEISGKVVAGDSKWTGKEVVVPAVMPCNKCAICASGRGNRCLAQKMPGNSMGIYGGFSSHIVVPADDLCVVENRGSVPLEQLSVVADAVTSPYQAAMRAAVKPGDNVIVTGATGGLGVYATQVLRAMGAKEVVAIARSPEKLKRALEFGATTTISSADKDAQRRARRFPQLLQRERPPLQLRMEDIRVERHAGRPADRLGTVLFRVHLGHLRLRHAEERIPALPSHGLRRRYPGFMGLSSQILPGRTQDGPRREGQDRTVRGSPSDEPDTEGVRGRPQGRPR